MEKPGKEMVVGSLRASAEHRESVWEAMVFGPWFSALVIKETCWGKKEGKVKSANSHLLRAWKTGGTEVTGPDHSVAEAGKCVLVAAAQGQEVGGPWDMA